MTTYLDLLMLRLTPSEYLSVSFSNQLLKPANNRPAPRRVASFCDGLRRRLQRAGVKDKAIKAESKTEIAIVMANCWYKRPTMPGMNPTGTNTAARISAIATTGADISFMA